MKLLTLNTHSWLEQHQPAKILATARAVARLGVQVLALQEANQYRDGLPLEEDDAARFRGPSTLRLRTDHYAHRLTEALAAEGVPFEWYWIENHIGYGIYDEGVGFAVRADEHGPEVLQTRTVLLGDHPYEDVRRRVALALQLRAEGRTFWVLSGHFSWWERDGQRLFAAEWEQVRAFVEEVGGGVVLLGDLNNPAGVPDEGYALLRSQGWEDAREMAARVSVEDTIVHAIDGWEGSRGRHRIDFILTTGPTEVAEHRVVFDGEHEPVVSDHYGVYAELTPPAPKERA